MDGLSEQNTMADSGGDTLRASVIDNENTLRLEDISSLDSPPVGVTFTDQGGTGQKTLDLRITTARKVFVETKTFHHVKRTLKQFGYVTVSGAAGEGKTTMGLMIAESYKNKGYHTAFVEDIDTFDLEDCLSCYRKVFFIFDDIFGSVGTKPNIPKQKKFLEKLYLHLQNSKLEVERKDRKKRDITQQTKHEDRISTYDNHPQKKGTKVSRTVFALFTSKTYNLEEGLSNFQYLCTSLFKSITIIDITKMSHWQYSSEEKKHMFTKHRDRYGVHKAQDEFDIDQLLAVEDGVFGFPLLCKLYFELPNFYSKNIEFFKNPLYYLREELNTLLRMRNDQSAALIFMMLFQDNMDLSRIEIYCNDEQIECWLQAVRDLVPSVTRTGICTAARGFRGTFFTVGDTISFAHQSMYDACACALYELNPSFVLKHCSLRFLSERVNTNTATPTTRVSEAKQVIFLSSNYHDLLLSRLAEAMNEGFYSKTVTHHILKCKGMVDMLLGKLETLQKPDRKKPHSLLQHIHDVEDKNHVLYWTTHGHNLPLLKRIAEDMKLKLTEDIIKENHLLDACASSGNKEALQYFLKRFRISDKTSLNGMLLTAAENMKTNIVVYLLKKGASIYTVDSEERNLLHLSCVKGNVELVQELTHFAMFQKLLNKVDSKGRLPIMTSVVGGNQEIFKHLLAVSDLKQITEKMDKDGNNLLHLACVGGNKAIIQRLIAHLGVNSRGENGVTPGMIALRVHAYEAYQLMVENEADLSLCDDYGYTFLHYAIECGNEDIVESLLDDAIINKPDIYGRTPIVLAALKGNLGVFEILSSTPNVDLSVVSFGNNLLHCACQGGNVDIVRKLLKNFKINSKGQNGWTPIMISAVYGHTKVFCLLRKNNANMSNSDDNGDCLFHLACKGGNVDIVRLFPLREINSKGNDGRTAIMIAALEGNLDVFSLLYCHKPKLSLRDVNGDSLLHLAARGGNPVIVQCVLRHLSIDLKGRDDLTPIMVASEAGHWNVLHLLHKKGAKLDVVGRDGINLLHCLVIGDIRQSDFSDLENKTNLSIPLTMAARSGNERIFKLLTSRESVFLTTVGTWKDIFLAACEGGNENIVKFVLPKSDIHHTDENKRCPLMIVAAKGHDKVFDLLFRQYSKLDMVDKFGDNILHLACQGGSINIVQRLLPCNINMKGRHGWTPIMKAAFKGYLDIFELLFKEGADVQVRASNGDTILHLACVGANLDIINILLTIFDINVIGEHGWTPAMKAAARGFTQMFAFLTDKNADLTLTDIHGDGILHLACRGREPAIMARLVTSRDMSRKGRSGRTPLMELAVTGNQEIFMVMFSALINHPDCLSDDNSVDSLRTTDPNGDSLLHLASQGGNKAIVETLLEWINVNTRGQYGWTPAMTAAYFGHGGVLELLIANGAKLTLLSAENEDILSLAKRGKNPELSSYLLNQPAVSSMLLKKKQPEQTNCACILS